MSSLYLNVYVQSDNATSQAAIRQFVDYVNAQDYEAVEAMDAEEKLYDVDDILASPIELRDQNGVLHLIFESSSSLEVEVLVDFFRYLGAVGVEISAFDSSSGGTFYVDGQGEYLDDYAAGSWKWLPAPNSGFVGQYVVVTGTFADYTRPALEELISQKGGKVQKSVNGKTTLLVMGAKPGADKTGKAESLGIRIMEEDELLDVLAGGDTLSVDTGAAEPETPDAPIIAYQYCFPPKDKAVTTLPSEVREELIALLRTNGYLNEHYYKVQLDNAREWHPTVAAKFREYRRAKDIPVEARGPLAPRSAWDIANLFQDHNTLITSYAPYIYEADKKGYGHALAQIAHYSGMPLGDIRYAPKAGTQGSFKLECTFEGKAFGTSFKYSPDTFPKPFLRLLHDMAAQSTSWDFIFISRNGERAYTVIPSALAQGLARHGFLKPLYRSAL
ncbi:BRCT domain-containing protein [Pseudomonas indica]|uniref:BRCA1 C Terminus (BRCT) domain-containing protein n=1 Tax=Pseudomonas indica TaxID=137658 RepID=A0A1G9MTN2_9PSED|nr:BRCT domain-containing protein [Pseudomonas indica]SDL76995.1 BRCA1 C Terminus (BRCT) domain-containing protein [Pseudomonas indica]